MQPTEDTESGTWSGEVARWAGTPQVETALPVTALGLSRWGKHSESRAGDRPFLPARSRSPDRVSRAVEEGRALGLRPPAGSELDYFAALGL